MTKITDIFKVGDSVKWVKVTRQGRMVDIRLKRGIVDEIIGSEAMIKIPGKIRRKRMSLYELENETRPYEPEKKMHRWPGSLGS